MKTFEPDYLKTYCANVIKASGVDKQVAETVAEMLVDAEVTGVTTHGVSRLGIYMQRVNAGLVSKENNVRILHESPAVISIDGGNTFGAAVAQFAMQECIRKAKEAGCCFASVRGSNHFGTCSFYTKQAAKENMIGFLCTNVTGKIAPWGSKTAYLGTNPFSVAIPTQSDPIVLDMTPTAVALGKLIDAQRRGEAIPIGWALDAEGKPTTDPAEGRRGSLVPIGGAKGSGMALIIEILCGILSGAGYSRYLHDLYTLDAPQGIGHFAGTIDVSHFIDVETFKSLTTQFATEIKQLEKAEGFAEVLLPGERGYREAKKSLLQGICLPDDVYEELVSLGAPYNLKL